MSVDWIEHRFAGGALALDVANTVVLRTDPDRSFDRFDDARELPRFAEAASRYRRRELAQQQLFVEECDDARGRLIDLRESIDALFRTAVEGGSLKPPLLADFLQQASSALRQVEPDVSLDRPAKTPPPLIAATALSGIALLAPEQSQRIRICDNCGWLFIDRSKNRSRRWCDMSVCGNRSKARRHYERRKETT